MVARLSEGGGGSELSSFQNNGVSWGMGGLNKQSWVRLAAYPARRHRAQGCGGWVAAAAAHWSLDFWDIA